MNNTRNPAGLELITAMVLLERKEPMTHIGLLPLVR